MQRPTRLLLRWCGMLEKLGCESQDIYSLPENPARSTLKQGKKSSRLRSCPAAERQIKLREREGPSLNVPQPSSPHERSFFAPKFDVRSAQEAARQEHSLEEKHGTWQKHQNAGKEIPFLEHYSKKGQPHRRSPCARTFADRAQNTTLSAEEFGRRDAWKRATEVDEIRGTFLENEVLRYVTLGFSPMGVVFGLLWKRCVVRPNVATLKCVTFRISRAVTKRLDLTFGSSLCFRVRPHNR